MGNTVNTEKPKTRYEQKLERKREQERKIARKKKYMRIFSYCAIAVLLLGLAAAIVLPIYRKQELMNGTYIQIGDHDISEFEYNYYFNSLKGSYQSLYASFGGSGVDFSGDMSNQQYSEDQTWEDFLDGMTIQQMKRNIVLLDEAEKQQFVYDDTEDYKALVDSFQSAAEQAGVKVSEYYKQSFGSYASEASVKEFIKDTLRVNAYYEELEAQNKPGDQEVTEYYEANKNSYDKVDYRSFAFNADVAEDASEEEVQKAMKEMQQKAEEMKTRLEAGEDFKALCIEYAPEDSKESYQSEENDMSLMSNASYAGIPTVLQDWAFDESRAKEDLTVAADEESNSYYVAQFLERKQDETTNESISSTLAAQKAEEIVTALEKAYEVKTVKAKISLPKETTETIAD